MLHAQSFIEGFDAVYIADTLFFPYGIRTVDELRTRLSAVVEKALLRFAPDVIVLACNTASVVALDFLRSRFSIPFVGTVPAVKPAALVSKNRRIGIMATEQTVKDPYLDSLISEYASDALVTRIPATGLIEGIENDFFGITADPELRHIAALFSDAGCDTVVLGCTHFIHLEHSLSGILDAQIIDSREGITRQIIRLLRGLGEDTYPELTPVRKEANMPVDPGRFLISALEREDYYRRVAEHFTLTFSGVMHV